MEYGKKVYYGMEWKIFNMEWKKFLQYGIWKNRLPFHSIACPDIKIQHNGAR